MITTIAVIAACSLGAVENVRIIEFTGQGCGYCQQVAPIVDRLNQAGCEIQQVDIHQQPEVAQAFGIREIPCFVVVRDDRVVDRLAGAASFEELSAFCQRARVSAVVRGQTNAPNGRGTIIDHLRERAAFAEGQPSPNVGTNVDTPAASRGLVVPATVVTQDAPPLAPAYPDFSAEPSSEQPARALPTPTPFPANLANARASAAAPAAATDPLRRALQATVRVRVEDPEGHSFGTGTVVDVHDHEALILTCGHIFRSSEGQGRITCDFFAAGGATVEGTLICYDIRRDVGLISARTNFDVLPVRVGGIGQQPRQGDRVFSVGCNHGESPSVIQNQILAVNRYHGPANLVVGGRPVDGRSGGGLFAQDGALIGVCNAADDKQDEGLYAALGPIHAELDRAGLAFVYGPHEPGMASLPRSEGLAVAPSQYVSESPDGLTHAPSASQLPAESPSQPSPLGPVADQTAPWTSVNPVEGSSSMTSGGADKLICVICTNQDGVAGSRVVEIDGPSAELVRHISSEVNQRGRHADTQLHVPARSAPVQHSSTVPQRGSAPRWEGDWR